MRRLLALLAVAFLLAASPALGDSTSPFRLGPVTAKQVAQWAVKVDIPAALVKPTTFAPDVPIPTAMLQFIAPLPVAGWLNEADILGSGYAVNMDGQDFLDSMTVKQEDDGTLRIDQAKVEPMGTKLWGPQQPYKENGKQKVFLLDPDGPYFAVLFYDPPGLALQLQHRGYIPTVRKMPNPTLEIVVFEFCEGIGGPADARDEPTFTLDFGDGPEPEQHVLYAWEPWACEKLGARPQWMVGRKAYVPMPTTPGAMDTSFTVNTTSGSDQVFMLTRVNYSVDPGTRLQSDAVVGLLWDGPTAPVK